MKQAILIVCGEEYERLPFLVEQFDERFNVYIHIDKKVVVPQKFVEGLKAKTGIRWMNQSFITNWGSMNLVNAILLLCEVALTEEDNTHFHLISGADFPAATNSEIIATCSSEKDNYIEFFPMLTPRWKEGGMNRLLYFHPLDILNSRNSMDRERYIRFLQVQQTLGIKRKLLDITYFGGSTWWSLSRTCVEYLIRNKCENNIYTSMQDTYIPDEMFVQTLLLNSPMKEFLRNDNRRYIVWSVKNGHIPANLDMEDYDAIQKSRRLFVRKTDKTCSWKLINRIAQQRKMLDSQSFGELNL